jgi:hypothetical protein
VKRTFIVLSGTTNDKHLLQFECSAGTQRIHRQDVESQQMRIPCFFSLADSATYTLFRHILEAGAKVFLPARKLGGLCVNIEGAPAT